MGEDVRIKAKMIHPETRELVDTTFIITREQYDELMKSMGPFSIRTKTKKKEGE